MEFINALKTPASEPTAAPRRRHNAHIVPREHPIPSSP